MEVAPRIDVPALMRALKSSDEVVAQNAGALLGHNACRYEEHREAISAQLENVIRPLVAHLCQQGSVALVHNAALLLGQLLMQNTEFRQAFDQDAVGPQALVRAMRDSEDAGVICNATWAIRHFFSDAKCELSVGLLDLAGSAVLPLLAHEDVRIQKHAAKLNTLIQQRQEHLKTTSLRREKAVQAQQAIAALAALSTGTEASDKASDDDEAISPTIGEHSQPLLASSPKKHSSKKAKSPRRLASWKKAMAIQFSAAEKHRKFAVAVNHAAAG